MKKFISLMLALLMFASMSCSVLAEDTNAESKFEKFLLAKGTLIVKEFVDFKEIGDTGVELQIASLTDVESGSVYRALRLTFSYWESKYDYGDAVGVLDADEVESVITTLEYIKQRLATGLKDYTEIIYTANSGLKVGAYYSAESQSLLLEASSKSKFLDVSNIDVFITTLKEAQQRLGT